MEAVRIDKWLWATRFFKTRSLATQACTLDHVKVEGSPAKASRMIHEGEVVEVRLRDITRTVRVTKPIGNRVGPKLVSEQLEDLTPAAEYERQKEYWKSSPAQRLRGAGRPTKKERREIGRFFEL
jgi:ribosome-associated heat shock protein Hsp15